MASDELKRLLERLGQENPLDPLAGIPNSGPVDPTTGGIENFSLKDIIGFPQQTLDQMDVENTKFESLVGQGKFREAAFATPTLNRMLGEGMVGAGIIKNVGGKFVPKIIEGGFDKLDDAQKFKLTAEKQRVREATLSEIFEARKAKKTSLLNEPFRGAVKLQEKKQFRVSIDKLLAEGKTTKEIEEILLPGRKNLGLVGVLNPDEILRASNMSDALVDALKVRLAHSPKMQKVLDSDFSTLTKTQIRKALNSIGIDDMLTFTELLKSRFGKSVARKKRLDIFDVLNEGRATKSTLRRPTRRELSEFPKEEQDRILKAFDEGRIEEVKLGDIENLNKARPGGEIKLTKKGTLTAESARKLNARVLKPSLTDATRDRLGNLFRETGELPITTAGPESFTMKIGKENRRFTLSNLGEADDFVNKALDRAGVSKVKGIPITKQSRELASVVGRKRKSTSDLQTLNRAGFQLRKIGDKKMEILKEDKVVGHLERETVNREKHITFVDKKGNRRNTHGNMDFLTDFLLNPKSKLGPSGGSKFASFQRGIAKGEAELRSLGMGEESINSFKRQAGETFKKRLDKSKQRARIREILKKFKPPK